MNGGIDKKGILFINRKGFNLSQKCKYSAIGEIMSCDHNCSHFGEPYSQGKHSGPDKIILELCDNKYLEFENFKDERRFKTN